MPSFWMPRACAAASCHKEDETIAQVDCRAFQQQRPLDKPPSWFWCPLGGDRCDCQGMTFINNPFEQVWVFTNIVAYTKR